MSANDNRWIITTKNFRRHRTYESALAEKQRLEASVPGVRFNMVRIKQTVEDAVYDAQMGAVEKELAK